MRHDKDSAHEDRLGRWCSRVRGPTQPGPTLKSAPIAWPAPAPWLAPLPCAAQVRLSSADLGAVRRRMPKPTHRGRTSRSQN